MQRRDFLKSSVALAGAEIEVKGIRYPVRWACHQKLNDDGPLTLRPNLRPEV